MKLTRLLSVEEYENLGNQAVANGMYRNDRRVFLPGMAWFQPWYWDHDGSFRARGKRSVIDDRASPAANLLSLHYWRDWADKRPPICVVCPNGEQWEIDRRSTNGHGWVVSGEFPNLTCSPSIVVYGYHGFLRNGEFTEDIEGRGANGIAR